VYRSHGHGRRRERGEKKKRVRARRPTPFEAEAGEAEEGWGSGVRRRVEGKTEEGSGVRRRGSARHGHGGSGLLRQRRAAYASRVRRARAANMGGRQRARRGTTRLTGGTGRHRGLVGSGWVREGVRGSETAAASAANRRGRSAQCRPVRF
jgi:hypothetical protein